VGRIYPQPFIAPSSEVALAKLSDQRTALPAAALLNDQGGPVFAAPEGPVSRLLTERGTEYWGSPDRHEDERSLAVENIDQTRPRGTRPQTTGGGERFHETLLSAFYRSTSRKKVYPTLRELQAALDRGLPEDNGARVHHGRWCDGRTPRPTFLDTIPLAKETLLAA
jgi:hypothetical protein